MEASDAVSVARLVWQVNRIVSLLTTRLKTDAHQDFGGFTFFRTNHWK